MWSPPLSPRSQETHVATSFSLSPMAIERSNGPHCSTTKETLMPKSPQRKDTKKVGKTLKEKREAKRSKQNDKKPLG